MSPFESYVPLIPAVRVGPSAHLNPPPAEAQRSASAGHSFAVTLAWTTPGPVWVSAEPGQTQHFVEAIVAAGRPDQRILLITPDGATADRLLERWPNEAIRALGPDEVTLGSRTSVALGPQRVHAERQTAASRLATVNDQLALRTELGRDGDILSRALADRARAEAAVRGLQAQQAGLEHDLRAEMRTSQTPFGAECLQRDEHHAAEVKRIEERVNRLTERLTVVDAKLEPAKRPGVLTGSFWKSVFGSSRGTSVVEKPPPDEDFAIVRTELDELQSERDRLNREYERVTDDRFAREIADRKAHLEFQLRQAEHELARVTAECVDWQNRLAAAGWPNSDPVTPEAVLAWLPTVDSLNVEKSQLEAILSSDPDEKAAEYFRHCRVVVGPRTAMSDPATRTGPFDLLLIVGAEPLTRHEFDTLSAFAERHVLIGEFPSRPTRHASGSYRNGSTPTEFAHQQWDALHRPIWFRDRDRLVCRLADVATVGITEQLADRHDVELTFGTTADGRYVLAEVGFAATVSVPDAKRFTAVELGDHRIWPLGPCNWTDPLHAVWPMLDAPDGTWIELEPGVRERVHAVDGRPVTSAVSFDPSLGWTSERAIAWVAAADATPPNRTIVLTAD